MMQHRASTMNVWATSDAHKHRKSTSDTETDLLLSSPETSRASTTTESIFRSQNTSAILDFLDDERHCASQPHPTTHLRNSIAATARNTSCQGKRIRKQQENMSTLSAWQREGEWWERQEDLDQALRVYKRCLASPDCKDIQTRTSLDAGKMHHSIGRIQWSRGDYRDCLLHYQRALTIYENHAGATLDLVDVFISKGQLHVSQGDSAGAKHCFRCALTALSALPEGGCRSTRSGLLLGKTHHGMAQVHEASGSLDRALNYCHDALDSLKLGPRDASISAASTLLTLGSIYEKQKHYEFSLGCFEEAYTLYTENHGSAADLGSTLAHIGWVYYLQHQYVRAIELYKHGLRTIYHHRRRVHNPNRNEAAILVQLGLAMAQCGQSKKAGRHLRRALSIQTQLLGGSHPDVATTLAAMSNVTTDAQEAFGLLDRAFQIRLSALGNQHVVVGVTLLGLGRLYTLLDLEDSSFRCYLDALFIFRSNALDKNDDRVVEAETLLRERKAALAVLQRNCAAHFPMEKSLLCAFS